MKNGQGEEALKACWVQTTYNNEADGRPCFSCLAAVGFDTLQSCHAWLFSFLLLSC